MYGDAASRRGRALIVASLLALVTLVTLATAAGRAAPAAADTAELDVFYTSPTTIQVKLADGTVVNSGGTIPGGSYMVVVYDPENEDTNPMFQITGPGVNMSSNLNSTGMGIDEPASFGPFTFQSGGSYSVEDTIIGSSTLVSFTAQGSSAGSGSSGSTGSTGSSGSSGSTGSSGSSGSQSSGGSSSSSSTTTAKVAAVVSSTGKPSLTIGGKALKTLKAGRYTVTVQDNSKKAGLYIGVGTKTLTLSKLAAVGKSTHSVTFTKGKWFVETTLHGTKTYFTVTAA